jgi:hypothetical protein
MATSAVLAKTEPYRQLFHKGSGAIAAMRFVDSAGDACGIGRYAMAWWNTAGHLWLPPNVRLYGPVSESEFATARRGFNYLLTEAPNDVPATEYQDRMCWDNGGRHDICLLHRPEACIVDAAPEPPVNWPKHLPAELRN